MTEHDRMPVTVVGLGLMGAALADAFITAGHPTTVWNRTTNKAAPLVAKGGLPAASIEKAISASPLVIACLTTYEATIEALADAGDALAGRALVTVNTGTPTGAREMAGWAARRRARYLDGAIMNVPEAVGGADTLLYYGGDRSVFDEHETTLRVLGGETVHLGDDPDLAALYDMAVGSTLVPSLLGFLHGVAHLRARGIEAASLVRYSLKWLEMIGSALPAFAEEVDTGNYAAASSSIGNYRTVLAEEQRYGREVGIDVSWEEPILELFDRAIAEGHGEHSISALVEVLGKPSRTG